MSTVYARTQTEIIADFKAEMNAIGKQGQKHFKGSQMQWQRNGVDRIKN
jgi:hypothetical protein